MAARGADDGAAILLQCERKVHRAASGRMRPVGNSAGLVHGHWKIESTIRVADRGGERDAWIAVDREIRNNAVGGCDRKGAAVGTGAGTIECQVEIARDTDRSAGWAGASIRDGKIAGLSIRGHRATRGRLRTCVVEDLR